MDVLLPEARFAQDMLIVIFSKFIHVGNILNDLSVKFVKVEVEYTANYSTTT